MAKQVVVRGATLKCTGSPAVSFLMVLPTLMVTADGADVATIDDHKPVVNIIPFGACILQGGQPPCIPVTPSPWSPGETTVQFGLRPVLDIESHLKCKHGGLITIQRSGQSKPFFAVDSQVSPLATHAAWYEARQRYLEALNEQFEAENRAEHVSGLDIAWNTVKETAKEASGYNDAGRAIDAFGRGDIGKGLLHAGMAVPNPAGKLGKGAKAAREGSEVVRAGRAAEKRTVERGGTVRHTSGETSATRRGREVHKRYNPGPGYQKEVTLPSGRRADAVDFKNKVVRELKPNNPRAIRDGRKQVEKYRQELQSEHGGHWRGVVDTYE